MTMTDKLIQLTNIDVELKRLWEEEQGQNKIRASLFNLILYAPKNETSAHYEKLVKSVISKFPCRVILIIGEENSGQGSLRTNVTSETVGIGDVQIYCEIIKVEASGKLMERVPFIILPHILPDLPIYLLWTQDPSKENAILPYLEPLANRIIFDPSLTTNIQAFSKNVLSLIHRFHCEIGDLKWTSGSGWRSLFASTFSQTEAFFCLTQSKTIRISYNRIFSSDSQNPEIEAAYFQAWLSSRMNWKFLGIETIEGNTRLTYKRPLTEIVFLLIPNEVPELKNGTLLSVDIESQKNKGHFSFKRHPKTRQIFIQYSDKDFCELPSVKSLSGISEGQEIIEEIFYPSGKQHYREMLDLLSQIPWRSTST